MEEEVCFEGLYAGCRKTNLTSDLWSSKGPLHDSLPLSREVQTGTTVASNLRSTNFNRCVPIQDTAKEYEVCFEDVDTGCCKTYQT